MVPANCNKEQLLKYLLKWESYSEVFAIISGGMGSYLGSECDVLQYWEVILKNRYKQINESTKKQTLKHYLSSYIFWVLYWEMTVSDIPCFRPISIIKFNVHWPVSDFSKKSSPCDQNKYIMSGKLFMTAHKNNLWKSPMFLLATSTWTVLPMDSWYMQHNNPSFTCKVSFEILSLFYNRKDFITSKLGEVETFWENLEYSNRDKFSLNILLVKIWYDTKPSRLLQQN